MLDVKGLGAEGGALPPLCFTGFFTTSANPPIKMALFPFALYAWPALSASWCDLVVTGPTLTAEKK